MYHVAEALEHFGSTGIFHEGVIEVMHVVDNRHQARYASVKDLEMNLTCRYYCYCCRYCVLLLRTATATAEATTTTTMQGARRLADGGHHQHHADRSRARGPEA
jgi:hypothetical protein